ncbi:hypothetical protein [Corallococcus sp. EGB]|uniref:hypothetical protein n=1 Tax=Corallococcus sp. EGB TaxID=1521117 RepID=UPI001CBB24D9|nr:hypothetical protein [Corallococcus sp. EGB]
MESGTKPVQVQTAPVTFQLGGAVPAVVLTQVVALLQGHSMNPGSLGSISGAVSNGTFSPR